MAARQHFVGDHRERPDVPRRIDFVAGDLLGRHVVERPDQQPGAGPRRGERRQASRTVERLGEPEVEHLRHDLAVVALKKDVLGLQIAMHEPMVVRGGQGRAHAAKHHHGLVAAERRAGGEPLAQRVPFEPFHHQKRPPVACPHRSRRRGPRWGARSRPRTLPPGETGRRDPAARPRRRGSISRRPAAPAPGRWRHRRRPYRRGPAGARGDNAG